MRRARVCRRLAARSMPLIRSMCSKAPAAISMVCRAATIICCRRGSCLALKPTYHFLTPSVAWQHSRRRQPARRTIAEQVEMSGTLRGRVGYAPNLATGTGNWLFYATGGFAWSYDQFTRTQIFGVPAGGTAIPGTVENAYMVPRVGGVVGFGVEVGLTPRSGSADRISLYRLRLARRDLSRRRANLQFSAGTAVLCVSVSIISLAMTASIPTFSPRDRTRSPSTGSRCTAR